MRPMRLPFLIAALLLSGCSSDKLLPMRTFNMGERVTVGHLVYVVYETQWLTHLGEGAESRVPQHRFFLVRMSATNGGNTDLNVPALTIQDDSGAVYHEANDGTGAPQWIGLLRSVKVAESLQGNALFDAPPRHYKLKIMDENSEQAHLIDIPLSFGSETPNTDLNPAEKK
jgi:hypothetical protein